MTIKYKQTNENLFLKFAALVRLFTIFVMGVEAALWLLHNVLESLLEVLRVRCLNLSCSPLSAQSRLSKYCRVILECLGENTSGPNKINSWYSTIVERGVYSCISVAGVKTDISI